MSSLRSKSSGLWRKRLGFALAALLPLTLTATAPPNPPPSANVSLAGQLLVATPAMNDPRFARTVIFMVRHSRDGAFGLVINRQVSERPLELVLEALGDKDTKSSGTVRIFVGGPVEPQRAFVLHSADYRAPESIVVSETLAMTASLKVFRDLAVGTGPKKSLIVFGYAGWAPGQLEGELAQNAWHTAPADLAFVLEADRNRLWELAVQRRTRDL